MICIIHTAFGYWALEWLSGKDNYEWQGIGEQLDAIEKGWDDEPW